ncbi:hypothetical protein BDA96_04G207700 [Sorghum bicolor]|uniref:HMA domain-containing protein n=2 Tax=Sorghum bicolor TaxID=4558 RepID=A0A921R5G3_SORBI|nr:heavy metal-associated isoprenylated plant protein 47 [Sorghum bicolor]KAG0533614.1 hypothetical protein BDA96_04G207700 [Sorghum bicolor]KXG30519.1 hypothetical protein SORBI_3004G195400 [Sorghum bicolor]|eukprot:XP_021313826.1 heavy metal-associated isoprenylated plant protein 47 [Sorghum bicolor]
MKQKIVIRVCMCCDKCRSKAMALAAATCGVDSVELDGKYRDEVVVVGEGVDSVKLTRALRKKVGHADLLHVSEVGIKKGQQEAVGHRGAIQPAAVGQTRRRHPTRRRRRPRRHPTRRRRRSRSPSSATTATLSATDTTRATATATATS